MDIAASNVPNVVCTGYWVLVEVHRLAVGTVASFVGRLARCVRLERRAVPGFLLGAPHSRFPPALRSGRFRGRAGILTGLPWLIGVCKWVWFRRLDGVFTSFGSFCVWGLCEYLKFGALGLERWVRVDRDGYLKGSLLSDFLREFVGVCLS